MLLAKKNEGSRFRSTKCFQANIFMFNYPVINPDVSTLTHVYIYMWIDIYIFNDIITLCS